MASLKGPEAPPLPTQDMLSWIFDEPTIDVDKLQAKNVVQQLIGDHRARGVKPGDCVLIDAFNDIYYMMLALAIIGNGAIFAGCNPAYTPFELTQSIETSFVTWLITEPEILSTILTAVAATSIPHSHIIIFHPFPTPRLHLLADPALPRPLSLDSLLFLHHR